MKNGIIYPDSKSSKEIGFSSNLFEGYLWKENQLIIISLIVSKFPNRGNLKALFDCIRNKGFDIFVPTPSNRMRGICVAYGMKSVRMEECEGMHFKNK